MNKRLANDFQFIDVGRGEPDKKTLQSRKQEYVEIYNPFTRDQVAEQSHRCSSNIRTLPSGKPMKRKEKK